MPQIAVEASLSSTSSGFPHLCIRNFANDDLACFYCFHSLLFADDSEALQVPIRNRKLRVFRDSI
jgi:hypothetical protein